MKKLTMITFIFTFCAIALFAQENSEQPKKSKVIVKKITTENVNGVETTEEVADTFDLSQLKDLEMEGFEWNGKELNVTDSLPGARQKMRIFMKKDGDTPFHDKDFNVFRMHPEHQAIWEEEQKVSSPNKAVLGVQLENVDGSNGAQVIEVFEGSAAEKIGLQEGDIIISVAGKQTRNVEELIAVLSKNKPGDKVKIKYLRETQAKSGQAILQERKEEVISKINCPTSKSCKVVCCKPGFGEKCDAQKIKRCIGAEGDKKIYIIKDKAINGNPKEIKIDIHEGEPSQDLEKGNTSDPTEFNSFHKRSDEQSLNVEVLTSSPNPNNGQMKISFEGQKMPTIIEVLDLNGKEIFKETIERFEGTYHKEIEIENTKGTLILKVTQGEKVLTQKIIVK